MWYMAVRGAGGGWLILFTCFLLTTHSEVAAKRKNETAFIVDPVGIPIPKPSHIPTKVGSPASLVQPDRYEFYTFDESGELIKRLMTLKEIQEIIATGDGDDGHVLTVAETDLSKPAVTFNFQQPSHTKIHSIVSNVQNVLKAEMEAQKTNPPKEAMFDTPDVSSSWSMILPAIFGNTGGSIATDSLISQHSDPETDVIAIKEKIESAPDILPTKDTTNHKHDSYLSSKPDFYIAGDSVPGDIDKVVDSYSQVEDLIEDGLPNFEPKTTENDLEKISTVSVSNAKITDKPLLQEVITESSISNNSQKLHLVQGLQNLDTKATTNNHTTCCEDITDTPNTKETGKPQTTERIITTPKWKIVSSTSGNAKRPSITTEKTVKPAPILNDQTTAKTTLTKVPLITRQPAPTETINKESDEGESMNNQKVIPITTDKNVTQTVVKQKPLNIASVTQPIKRPSGTTQKYDNVVSVTDPIYKNNSSEEAKIERPIVKPVETLKDNIAKPNFSQNSQENEKIKHEENIDKPLLLNELEKITNQLIEQVGDLPNYKTTIILNQPTMNPTIEEETTTKKGYVAQTKRPTILIDNPTVIPTVANDKTVIGIKHNIQMESSTTEKPLNHNLNKKPITSIKYTTEKDNENIKNTENITQRINTLKPGNTLRNVTKNENVNNSTTESVMKTSTIKEVITERKPSVNKINNNATLTTTEIKKDSYKVTTASISSNKQPANILYQDSVIVTTYKPNIKTPEKLEALQESVKNSAYQNNRTKLAGIAVNIKNNQSSSTNKQKEPVTVKYNPTMTKPIMNNSEYIGKITPPTPLKHNNEILNKSVTEKYSSATNKPSLQLNTTINKETFVKISSSSISNNVEQTTIKNIIKTSNTLPAKPTKAPEKTPQNALLEKPELDIIQLLNHISLDLRNPVNANATQIISQTTTPTSKIQNSTENIDSKITDLKAELLTVESKNPEITNSIFKRNNISGTSEREKLHTAPIMLPVYGLKNSPEIKLTTEKVQTVTQQSDKISESITNVINQIFEDPHPTLSAVTDLSDSDDYYDLQGVESTTVDCEAHQDDDYTFVDLTQRTSDINQTKVTEKPTPSKENSTKTASNVQEATKEATTESKIVLTTRHTISTQKIPAHIKVESTTKGNVKPTNHLQSLIETKTKVPHVIKKPISQTTQINNQQSLATQASKINIPTEKSTILEKTSIKTPATDTTNLNTETMAYTHDDELMEMLNQYSEMYKMPNYKKTDIDINESVKNNAKETTETQEIKNSNNSSQHSINSNGTDTEKLKIGTNLSVDVNSNIEMRQNQEPMIENLNKSATVTKINKENLNVIKPIQNRTISDISVTPLVSNSKIELSKNEFENVFMEVLPHLSVNEQNDLGAIENITDCETLPMSTITTDSSEGTTAKLEQNNTAQDDTTSNIKIQEPVVNLTKIKLKKDSVEVNIRIMPINNTVSTKKPEYKLSITTNLNETVGQSNVEKLIINKNHFEKLINNDNNTEKLIFNNDTKNNNYTTSAPQIQQSNEKPQLNDIKKDEIKVNLTKLEVINNITNESELSNSSDTNIENEWKLIPTVTPKNETNKNETHKKIIPNNNYSLPTSYERPILAHGDLNVVKTHQPQNIGQIHLPGINGAEGLEKTTSGLSEDVFQFSQLCNELALRYWDSVSSGGLDPKRSLVISPFADTSILAMVFLGARGATSGEMNEILKLDDMVTFNPHIVFKNVTESIEVSKKSGVATSAFIREIFSDRAKGRLLSFYKDRVQQFYNGHVEEVNFNNIGDIIRRRTNLLVKRQTWSKIPEYIKANNMVLRPPLSVFSANIFQTDCSVASTEGRDGEMYFVVSPTIRQRRLIPVPAVVYKTGFLAGYVPELDATAVAIDKGDQIVSTIFIMPGQQGSTAHGDDIIDLQKRLLDTAIKDATWNKILRSLIPRPGLELQIPRLSHRSVINGTQALRQMGLKDLFDAEKADLRGLNGQANDLYLSDLMIVNTFATCGEGYVGDQHHVEVYPGEPNKVQRRLWRPPHKPIVENNQHSPMASEIWDEPRDYQRAFHDPLHDMTYLLMPLHLRPRQARLPNALPEPPRLKFDRPFMFFVRHNPTGLILHMGRYNPRLLP